MKRSAKGTFAKGNLAAYKGEPRRMWAGRLPESTHSDLKALVESRAFRSQSDAIAAAVARLVGRAPEGSAKTDDEIEEALKATEQLQLFLRTKISNR